MKTVERIGKSTSTIIADFMRENNMKLEDFKFEVLDEGSSGFLHLFGSKPAKIQFTIPDIGDYIDDYIHRIVSLMEIQFNTIDIQQKDDIYFVTIKGVDDAGFVIGKSAKLLDSLQYLLNQMINKKMKQKIRLKLNVNDYRERSNNHLVKKVNRLSNQVKQNGKSATLEPLPSSHRRIVHKVLEKDDKLRTMTIGEGKNKRIVIVPEKNDNQPVKKKKPRKKYVKKKPQNQTIDK